MMRPPRTCGTRPIRTVAIAALAQVGSFVVLWMPYAVSVEGRAEELTLVTPHVIWGDDEQKRADELREIATWLADWPSRESTWSKNLITTGLTTPPELNDVPRTIFDESSKQHFYDQIAWFQEDAKRCVLSLNFLSAGSFDFVPLLQGGLTKTQLSWKISDHYPLWVEFSV